MIRPKLFLLFTGLLLSIAAVAQDRPPNVILLIGDDHGYPYFGFMGDQTVVTPSMDAIAEGGVVFTQAHTTASYCRPSLRTLVTGLHPVQYALRKNALVDERRGVEGVAEMSEDERGRWQVQAEASALRDFDTLPKLLAERGYASWEGGKWWEGPYQNGHFTEGMTQPWDMSKWGTDEFFYQLWGNEGYELGRTTMAPMFDFIDRHQDQPFLIWYGPALPHVPLDAPYRYRKFYEHKQLSNSAKAYYANITWWDEGVGQIMDHIESLGLLEDTLFVYVSDNGWEQEPQQELKEDPDAIYNDEPYASGGLKGKGALYDSSFRTPVIFYWKGHIQGSFNETSLITSADIVPTILDIAGARIPEELPGHSLRPALEGEQLDERLEIVGYSDRRRSTTSKWGEMTDGYYVRTHRWHFMHFPELEEMHLYDVTVDPWSENNVIDENRHLVDGFLASIQRWQASMGMTGTVRMD